MVFFVEFAVFACDCAEGLACARIPALVASGSFRCSAWLGCVVDHSPLGSTALLSFLIFGQKKVRCSPLHAGIARDHLGVPALPGDEPRVASGSYSRHICNTMSVTPSMWHMYLPVPLSRSEIRRRREEAGSVLRPQPQNPAAFEFHLSSQGLSSSSRLQARVNSVRD